MHKLGKLPRRLDKRTLKLSDYLPSLLPPIPSQIDWGGKVKAWGEMGNDNVGDCTIAASGHMEMVWTVNTSGLFVPTDQQILAAYSAISGYDPSNPTTDAGANCLDVLNYWRDAGIASHKISAYVSVDPDNPTHMQASISFYGGLYLGVNLSQEDMDEFDLNESWQDTDGDIIGGHAIPVIAFDQTGVTVITWGRRQLASWAWLQARCDEAYCCLSPDWIANGSSPGGLNVAALQKDLNAVSN